MDDFLREIYTTVFKQWILNQNYDDIIIKENNDTITLDTQYSHSEIIFHEMSIIELSVTNLMTNDIEFFLHFQLNTLHHGLELFNEMLDCIKKLVNKPVINILLCCTSGLTTGFFAEQINEAIELLKLNYHVDAVAYNELYHEGLNYDYIFLAPQISYMQPKIKGVLKDKVVEKIPSAIFAKYDTGEMIKLIEDVSTPIKDEIDPTLTSLKDIKKHNCNILCISVIRNSNRVHVMYNIYDRDNMCIKFDEVLKPWIGIRDIYDVIDTCIARYKNIGMIGLSLPGIIHNGYNYSSYLTDLNNKNLDSLFKNKYNIPFIYSNDINAAAVGYYASIDDEDDLSLLFQPIYYHGGIGNIINGHLFTGSHNLSGQIEYLPLNMSKEYTELVKTPEGSIELISKIIIDLCTYIDPKTIVICSQLITDINELKKEISQTIPEMFIPQIVQIEHLHKCMLLGQLVLCVKNL
jgi:cellobiose-specific phosphotransferase system component IIB